MKHRDHLPQTVSFGQYLKTLRVTKRMGLRELARALSKNPDLGGVTHAYLSSIESGQKPAPRPRILRALASVFAVSPIEVEMVAQGWTVIRAADLLRQLPNQASLLAQLETGTATSRDVLQAITDSYEYTPLSLDMPKCLILDDSQGILFGFRRRSSTGSLKETKRPQRRSSSSA